MPVTVQKRNVKKVVRELKSLRTSTTLKAASKFGCGGRCCRCCRCCRGW